MSRTTRSAWTLASGVGYNAITVLVGFAATPVLLRYLGTDRFGAIRAMQEWFAYLALLDLGMTGSLVACMGPSIARNETEQIKGWLSVGLRLYLLICSLMVMGGLMLVSHLPQVLQADTLSRSELQAAGLVLMVPTLLAPSIVFRALAEIRQRGYLVNFVLGLQALLNTVLVLAAALLGWGLPGQALAISLAQIPLPVLMTAMAFREFPGFWKANRPRSDWRRLFNLNWQTFLYSTCGQIGLLSDNLIIGAMLGPAAVTSFFLTQRIATVARSQLQQVGNATFAGLLDLHSKGEMNTFRERLLDLTRVLSAAATLLLGLVAVYNPYLVERWVGANQYGGNLLNLLAVVSCWFWSIIGLWTWPIAVTGNIGKWLPYLLVSTVLNVLVSVAGTRYLGLAGPVLGSVTGFVLVGSWAAPLVLRNLFGIAPRALWQAAGAPLAWTLPYLLLVYYGAAQFPPRDYVTIAAQGAAAGLVGLALLWTVGLSQPERAHWNQRLQLAFVRPQFLR